MLVPASAVEELVTAQTKETGLSTDEGLLYPGPKMALMALAALPPAVVGLSASGPLELVSGIISVLWFAMLPAALYWRWARQALPFIAASLLALAIFALPFKSSAFIFNYWSSAPMLILALLKT